MLLFGKGILFLFSVLFSTMLTACVFVTRDTVRHPRRFVSENLFVNRIVRDPRRSWTEVWLYYVWAVTVVDIQFPQRDIFDINNQRCSRTPCTVKWVNGWARLREWQWQMILRGLCQTALVQNRNFTWTQINWNNTYSSKNSHLLSCNKCGSWDSPCVNFIVTFTKSFQRLVVTSVLLYDSYKLCCFLMKYVEFSLLLHSVQSSG